MIKNKTIISVLINKKIIDDKLYLELLGSSGHICKDGSIKKHHEERYVGMFQGPRFLDLYNSIKIGDLLEVQGDSSMNNIFINKVTIIFKNRKKVKQN